MLVMVLWWKRVTFVGCNFLFAANAFVDSGKRNFGPWAIITLPMRMVTCGLNEIFAIFIPSHKAFLLSFVSRVDKTYKSRLGSSATTMTWFVLRKQEDLCDFAHAHIYQFG
jgi:hypothetical protein